MKRLDEYFKLKSQLSEELRPNRRNPSNLENEEHS